MQKFFGDKAIKQVLSELAFLGQYDEIDFSDLDFHNVQTKLASGPAAKLLPPPNPEYQKLLPALNTKGEYTYVHEGHKIVVPAKYVPMVNYAFYTFSNVTGFQQAAVLRLLWEWIERVLRWVLHTKLTIHGQLRDILSNTDKNYQKLRDRIKELKREYKEDPTLEVLCLIPDLFVYICRLLSEKNVPKEFKVEVVLALIYLISPMDFIPEGLIVHPIAFFDDIGVCLFVIKRAFDRKYVSREILKKHWPGEVSLIDNLGEWYKAVENVIGGDFIETIASYLHRKTSVQPS